MSHIDYEIKSLGYEEVKIDFLCNYIVYQNKQDDTEVTIQWDMDDSECLIYVQTISEIADFYGNLIREPMGLTCKEYEVFHSKIQECRKLES